MMERWAFSLCWFFWALAHVTLFCIGVFIVCYGVNYVCRAMFALALMSVP